jgi:hypothetical protein
VLDWIADGILAIVTAVPAWFVSEDSANFILVRAMFGLLLIVLIVFAIAMWPSRSAIALYMRKAANFLVRRS